MLLVELPLLLLAQLMAMLFLLMLMRLLRFDTDFAVAFGAAVAVCVLIPFG